jgi:lactate permease
MQQADLFKTLAALIPIAVIFIAMLAFKLSSWKAGGLALIFACLLAFFIWKLSLSHMGQAAAEGVLTGLFPICWVIFSALLVYNLSVRCGAMDAIRKTLTRYAPDEASLVLLIAFGFGSFLESVSGFGTPVVVPAAILILFGFEPMRAAVICLAANTVAVAFGVVGIPVITLAGVTGLPVQSLSFIISLQLFIFAMLLPCLLVFMTVKSWKGLKKHLPLCLAAGFTFAAVQTLTAWLTGAELPAIAASLCAMLVIILWQSRHVNKQQEKTPAAQTLKPWCAYIAVLALVLGTRLIPALGFLGKAPFMFSIPIYEGQTPFTFAWLTNPGTILLISAVIFSLVYKIKLHDFFITAGHTLKQVKNAALTVVLIVALAKVLSHSGMTGDIALGIAAASGAFFPLISPLIGCIGTFVTGSDTSANILFGQLQYNTAILIGANPLWLCAANTAGATVGKMISPLSIALAAASTGLKGQESGILRAAIKYAAVLIALMAVLIWAASFIAF